MKGLTLAELNVVVPSEHIESANKYLTDIFSRLPENTQRSYKSDLKSFYQYCFLNDMSGLTPDIKSTETAIKSYVTSMCHSQLAYSTIVHRMATLNKFMSVAKFPNPLKESEYLRDFIKLEMQDFDVYNKSTQAPALRIETLKVINSNVSSDKLINARDLSIINLMFDSLLRSDELTSVQLKHVDFENNKLFVPKSKSDQTGKGSYRFISNRTLEYIKQYLAIANNNNKNGTASIVKGILFRSLSPKGTSFLPYDESITRVRDMIKLNYSTVYRLLKRVAKKANVDLEVTGHSPRVGGAVSMKEAGMSLEQIKEAGAWESLDMPEYYTHQANNNKVTEVMAEIFDR